MNPDTVGRLIGEALTLQSQASGLIHQALDELATANAPAQPPIATPADLDRALASAVAGSVLALDPTLVYPSPLRVPGPGITLASSAPPRGRMTKEFPAPRFERGALFLHDATTCVGLDFREANHATDVVSFLGAMTILDRCRVLGDPVAGAKRGIAANGGGDCAVIGSYVDDCFGPYPDPNNHDRMALGAWDMGPGLVVEDNYLCGGGITVLFGGSDPSTEQRTPRRIQVRGNTLTKNPAWQAQTVAVKNCLEFKNAREVLVENNAIEYSWGGRGQDGFLIVLTPRNQNGRAPWCTVDDIEIRNNQCAHAAAAISIMGSDDNKPSGRLTNVRIHDNHFDDLDPKKYTGAPKLIQIQRGPAQLAIVNNAFVGVNFTSNVYFTDTTRKADGLDIYGNTWPRTKYGIFGSGTGVLVNKAWPVFVTTGTLGPNTDVVAAP